MATDRQDVQRVPQTGSEITMRRDFSGEEVAVAQDATAVAAAAAAAKAEIEARIVQAQKIRRNVDQVRLDMLADCRRPGFAEAAIYRKPVGRKQNANGDWEDAFAEGFSVRFIEAALQHYGNVHVTARVIYENPEQSKLGIGVVDVQNNVGYYLESTIDKLVERREVKKGRQARGVRQNSTGQLVYLVEATRDEFRNLMGSERSKLMRDCGRRLLPPDILDECREVIDTTLRDDNARDPAAAKKKVLDKFNVIGVSAVMLGEYLERPIESLGEKDLTMLRALYTGLKEGDFTWQDVMRTKQEPAEGEQAGPATPSKLREIVMNKPSFTRTPPEEKN